ncbi:MAG: class I SAM-dependent methyltransferase [Candidatus Micrarchaeota archaeon]|nr:class I SAM-dependent methyltransferase [Candidatus Micrarchaeota archaeon]
MSKENYIEIRDKEIDVSEIMKKIRENIRKRRKEHEVIDAEVLERMDTKEPPFSLERELASINANWDVENKTYRISSHRKLMGPLLVKGRELVHGEVQRYVRPILWKQTEFNTSTMRILNRFSKTIPEIKKQVDEQSANLSQTREDKDERADINYLEFENKFRGKEDDIKNKQEFYTKYFKSRKNVLDIGCGRGEFLELLKEKGVRATGIDNNKGMVYLCRKKGLNVIMSDAVEYLQSIPNSSIDGIFISHVLEHFKPKKIVEFIKLANKKLKNGSYLVIGTPNPLSFFSLSHFSTDPSHVNPLNPLLMEFLLSSSGFNEVNVMFHSPTPEELQLKKIKENKKMTEFEREFTKVYNANVEKLNSTIYGYQDYTIVGKK